MYLKYFLISAWIIESILLLEIESKVPDLNALHIKKNPDNCQGYLHNGNKSRMVAGSKINYDEVQYEDSADYILKGVNDVSKSGNSSYYSSSRLTTHNAENPKLNESSELSLNSNFNRTVELYSLKRRKSIFENESHKMPLANLKGHKQSKEYFLNWIKTVWKNGNLHLCISVPKKTMDKNYLYECRSKAFRNFACVDKDGKLGPCNKYASNKRFYDQLCIKKVQFTRVISCNRPEVGFCFPASDRTGELVPCHGEKLRICYRSGYGLVDCKMVEEQRVLSHKRRSVQGDAIDPRNVQCSDCEVDIFMEVYEGSTPKIEVKIRPLQEPIHHRGSIKSGS